MGIIKYTYDTCGLLANEVKQCYAKCKAKWRAVQQFEMEGKEVKNGGKPKEPKNLQLQRKYVQN